MSETDPIFTVLGKARRARHEAEISRIRREMQNADAEHKAKVSEIERSLIETRIRVQREADAKLQTMQSEAQMVCRCFVI